MIVLARSLRLLIFAMLVMGAACAQQQIGDAYPKITTYFAIANPILTEDKNGNTFNFSPSYTVGFPVGINVLKNEKIGFGFELIPFIKVENGTDRVSNLLFHPGVIFRCPKGFTFVTRLAFETSGRYGITPIFNKVVARTKNVSYFIGLPLPIRFGNDRPASVTAVFLMGITF